MKACPVCTTELLTADRHGIEIDHCPRCRGVWLDRGELDRLIERTAHDGGHDDHDDGSDWGDGRRHSRYGYREPDSGHFPAAGPHPPGGQHPPKKKGFFGRLFDFD